MKIGYARVSTKDQDTAMQIDALQKAGCEQIFDEQASGMKTDRAELESCLRTLRKDDVLIVWKIDRLARSVQHLLALVKELDEKGVGFVSLTDKIDTTSAHGRFFFTVNAAFVELEREIISERVKAGLAHAKKNGRVGGRCPALDKKQIKLAKAMFIGGASKSEIARNFGVSRTTVIKFLKEEVVDS